MNPSLTKEDVQKLLGEMTADFDRVQAALDAERDRDLMDFTMAKSTAWSAMEKYIHMLRTA